MRKMKRSRGLGGTAAQHESRAEFYVNEAQSYLSDATAHSARKECPEAFQTFVKGQQLLAQAVAHKEFAPKASTVGLDQLSQKAQRAFRKVCVRGFEKLDGLGARRKSRR